MRFSAASTAERLLPERLALRLRPLVDRIDEIVFDPGERGEASRMSLIAFTIRVVSAAIAFVSQVLLARWMGGFEYGIFVLVWTAMVIAGSVACFGFHTSVIRFIPEYRDKGMLAELRGVLLTSRRLVLFLSTGLALVAMAAVWLASDRIEPYYVVPFILGLFCVPMIALSDLLQGVARAYSWGISALAPTYITRPVLILAFMAGALALSYPPTAEIAIWSAILGTYATTIIQLAETTADVDAKLPPGPRTVHLRTWIIVSLPIFLIEGFSFLLTNADVLMVGLFLPPNEVGIYFATVKTLALVHFVYFAVKAGVAQRYSQFAHGDKERLAEFARETAAWTFWPSLLMGGAVLLIGDFMLKLFGPGFEAGYPLLFPLVFGVVARASVGPSESLLTMSDHQNICAVIYAVTLVVNVALSVILIPRFGLWGAAFANAASMTFEAAVLSFTAWRKLGIVMMILLPPLRSRRAS
ncbi:lipopolysaccharide biosynthesis protein [Pseudaminobacter sp. 19-2017]|uniref:Lipopolysaccharide biosynthesis protein n=1 Tax=Pseudaminobacter soli (ex Zhang et al. 2022) TaxID=2831468 RepID=A0A942I745_9HYPH|nr:lipopolysaccharide biosynthesis protein [Pseudaminobacter soli]